MDARPSLVDVASELDICVNRFGNAAVDVDIIAPGGKTRRLVASGGSTRLNWQVVPGDPVGTYTIRATQGALTASGTFTVQAASRPHVLPLEPTSQRAGATFRFALAGFKPGASVFASLFSTSSFEWTYLAELPPAVTDSEGKAIYALPTRTTDPRGQYCVDFRVAATAPVTQCWATFVVLP